MDALLNLGTQVSYVSQETLFVKSEETRDYVKILHALIAGDWSAERTPEDEQVL
jgi:hypothetical protein